MSSGIVRLALIAAVASALGVLVPRPADAQPAPQGKPLSDAAKKKIAKGYVDAGLAAEAAGDYATALDLYVKAYALVPHPVLLFNQANVQARAGRRAEAIALYRAYLGATPAPAGPQVAAARASLAKLEAEIAIEQAAAERAAAEQAQAQAARDRAAAAAAEEQAAGAAAEAARADRERAARDAAVAPDPAVARPATGQDPGVRDAPPDRGRTMRVAGLVTGAAGVVALGVGVAFGVQARSISDELSATHAAYSHARHAEGEAAERNFVIASVAGGALVAGGAALYFLGRARARESTRVTIAPRTDGAVVVFAGVLP